MKENMNEEMIIMEEVTLEDVEVLEETLTPGAGFDCSYNGWLGFGC